MSILSFQSRVSYGCVGHAAAEFTLRRIGHDVWPIDTVRLSNHPGYGQYSGGVVAEEDIAALVAGLDGIGALAECRAVLSGYLGSVGAGQAALAACAAAKAQAPDCVYCCDPVMGDRPSGLYVGSDLVTFFREAALAAADLLVPNHFELEVLSGRALPTLAEIVGATADLRRRGPMLVCVTSLRTTDLGSDLGTLLVTGEGAWLVVTPHLEMEAKGAGDVFSALLLARLLDRLPAAAALEHAVAAVYAVVAATVAAGGCELALIEAQNALVAPPRLFSAHSLAPVP